MKSRMPVALRNAPVRDAEADYPLTILQSDIDTAVRKDPTSCAAANACKRQLQVCEAYVMRSRTYANLGTPEHTEWVRYKTPISLQKEIVAIDRGGMFMPGQHNLKALTKSEKVGYCRARTKKRSGYRSSRPKRQHYTQAIR